MHRRPATYLLVVLGCAVAATLVHVAAFGTVTGGRADAAVLARFVDLQPSWFDWTAAAIVRLCDAGPYVLLAGALGAVALAQNRPRHALVALAMLGGAAATTQVLKHVLAAPRPVESAAGSLIPEASWPSGHTTGAVALALALVLVAPQRLRPAAAVAGAAFAGTVMTCLLLLDSHYPSDVLGGICVATAWLAIGLAALRATDARAASTALRPQAVLVPAAAVVLSAVTAVAAFVAARPESALAFADKRTTVVTAATVFAAAGAALVVSAATALRHR